MNIYILRHGQTEENKKKFYYGALDIELNEIGKEQGKKVGNHLKNIKFDKIFVSEKKRTLQMVREALGENIECIKDSRINERNFGVFEGLTYDEIKESYIEEYNEWEKEWMDFCIPSGESHKNMCIRVFSFMDDILKNNEENILITAHAGVMRAIYCYIMDKNINMFWKFGCKNADLALLKYEFGNLYIDSIIPFAHMI